MSAAGGLHRLPVRMLSDIVSARALDRILNDAAQARGRTPQTLDATMMEEILKNEVFKRLQLSVPAPLAKRRVMDVLSELSKTTQERVLVPSVNPLLEIEEQAKRYSLYFDWPETQRLRGVLSVAQQQFDNGQDISALVQEGQGMLDLLDRRLQEGLVTQKQDLAELKASYERVQGMGVKEVRRLEKLIEQISEAQSEGTLLTAEVERARNITFKLRKQLESSVVQPLEGAGNQPAVLDVEAQARVLAMEQEHVTRLLGDLSNEFATLIRFDAHLQARSEQLQQHLVAGNLTEEMVSQWRSELQSARQALIAQQSAQLQQIQAQLAPLPDSAPRQEALTALEVARVTLSSGGLATEELRDLVSMVGALQSGSGSAEGMLEDQRLLTEIERTARDVPGALDELTPLLAKARDAMNRGERVNQDELWNALERKMGEAAQQRQNFDARADYVIRQYDEVRSLAGETIQRLGRLADALRAQRRLGPMSASARQRYATTLEEAEALLNEAEAEYRAAQEVTASFGEEALSGLLDVFDFGVGDSAGTSEGLFNPTDSSDDEFILSDPTPVAGLGDNGLPHNAWTARSGSLVLGPADPAASHMAALLGQAERLGIRRAHFEDQSGLWSATQTPDGEWRIARASDIETLDQNVGDWLNP